MGNCLSGGAAAPSTAPQAQAAPQASVPAPAGDPISQGLGDASQAIGLIDGIYKIVEPAVLAAANKRNETSSLKKFLGGWWKEAFEYGACMVPVLDIDDFEKYLERTNGALEPRGNCSASSPWGYLLHSLAINPGDKVLTWKPATGARWDMPNGRLAMDVRGAAFCHLINLYNITIPVEDDVDIQGKRHKIGSCGLSFGFLSWTGTEPDHISATFEPDTIPKINGPKQPLYFETSDPDETFWASYKAALETGISDPEMVWPDPETTPLAVRVQHLAANMERLEDGRSRIFTAAWLEFASRIKIRTMSNGGNDNSFLEDAYRVLAEHPERKKMSDYAASYVRTALADCFFFEDDRFTIKNVGRSKPKLSQPIGVLVEPPEVLSRTLNSYRTEDPLSWKGQLYASKELVLTIALMKKHILIVTYGSNRGVMVLRYTPADPLWSARVHL